MRTSLILIALLGCGDKETETGTNTTEADTDTDADADADTDTDTDTDADTDTDTDADTDTPVETTCTLMWDEVTDLYSDVGKLGSCDGKARGEAVEASMMNLDGVTVEIRGTTFTPCTDVMCDDDYVYISSNNLQHYDAVSGVPAIGEETRMIFRLPLEQSEVNGRNVDDIDAYRTCDEAYAQYLSFPDTATVSEPGGLCYVAGEMSRRFTDGEDTFHRVSCLTTNGFVINGQWIVGSSEATDPDPYGNPVFFYPETGSGSYQAGTGSPVLDLCGAHGHHHGQNPECFALESDNTPTYSYDEITSRFDMATWVDGLDCDTEGNITGWAVDGTPIMGPCACMARDGDGACTDIRRVRSSYAYVGLSSYGDDPDEEAALGTEGDACTSKSTCGDDMTCNYALFSDDSAAGGTRADRRCVLVDYTHCTHDYVDRSGQDMSGADFVYLDRCNGLETADGYRYFFTGSYPYVPLCFRSEPSDSFGGGVLDQ